jgi:hypothetical protein
MMLQTHLSPEECRTRLVERADPYGFVLRLPGNKPNLGNTWTTTFRLRRKRDYANPNAPYFYGRLLESTNGTTIDGKFQMHPFTRGFLVCVALFLVCANLLVPHPEPCMTAGMVAMFALFVALGKALARGEKEAIIAFLKSQLEANEELLPV